MGIYETMIILWFSVFIVTTILEFITLDLVSVWFALAALITLIISFFPNISWQVQVLIFILLTSLLLLITRPILKKYFAKNISKTNIDSYIGKTAHTLSNIDPIDGGTVMFNSIEWSAISDEFIEKDSLVTVLDIKGVKLKVKKKEN